MRIKLILITRSKNGMMEHRKLQRNCIGGKTDEVKERHLYKTSGMEEEEFS